MKAHGEKAHGGRAHGETAEELAGWFAGRLPDEWFSGPPEVTADREETRDQRMRIADEAERRFRRKVSWGAECGGERVLFTTMSVPVMTRLRMDERAVLDTLVRGGVARSRSHALAWCVRLVGTHQGDWIKDLQDALVKVQQVRDEGPE